MGVSALRSCRNDHFLIYLFYLTIYFFIFFFCYLRTNIDYTELLCSFAYFQENQKS